MALYITCPTVITKIEALAKQLGMTKTAAVERAVDVLLTKQDAIGFWGAWDRFDVILAQIDLVPEIATPSEPPE